MTRTKELQDFLNALGHQQAENLCVAPPIGCGKPVKRRVDPNDEGAFRDELSLTEYGISGFCQKCQDIAFAPPSEEEDAPADKDEAGEYGGDGSDAAF